MCKKCVKLTWNAGEKYQKWGDKLSKMVEEPKIWKKLKGNVK